MVVAGPAVAGASSPRLAVGRDVASSTGWRSDLIAIDVGKHYVDPTVPVRVHIPPPRWLVPRHAPIPTSRVRGLSGWQVDPYQD